MQQTSLQINDFSDTSAETDFPSGFFGSFYNEALYRVPEQAAAETELAPQGNPDSALLVLAVTPTGALQPVEQDFLQKILKPVGQALEDVLWLTVQPGHPLRWRQVARLANVRQALVFGAAPQMLPPGSVEGQFQREGHIRYIAMPAIEHLAANVQLKQVLWHNMKQLFGIK